APIARGGLLRLSAVGKGRCRRSAHSKKLDWIKQSSLLNLVDLNESSAGSLGYFVSQSARGNPEVAFLRSNPAALCPRVDGYEWIGSSDSSGGTGQSQR